MGDLYREILVPRRTPMVNKVAKVAAIAATAIFLVGGMFLMAPLFLLVGIVLGIGCFFLLPRLEVEYEYLYVNGELDVDAIYSRQKRKRIGSYDMAELEVLAPEKSHALDPYQSQGVKIKDFTSGDPQVKAYVLVFSKEGKRDIIKAELDDVILNDVRRIAPRKVNLY